MGTDLRVWVMGEGKDNRLMVEDRLGKIMIDLDQVLMGLKSPLLVHNPEVELHTSHHIVAFRTDPYHMRTHSDSA